MVILEWEKKFKRIPLFTIHDAYGVPYGYREDLISIVRLCLIKLFDDKPLERYIDSMKFKDEIKAKLHKKIGDLTVDNIKQSRYWLR